MYSSSALTNWGPAALISAPESGRMSREACPWHMDTCMLRPFRDEAFVDGHSRSGNHLMTILYTSISSPTHATSTIMTASKRLYATRSLRASSIIQELLQVKDLTWPSHNQMLWTEAAKKSWQDIHQESTTCTPATRSSTCPGCLSWRRIQEMLCLQPNLPQLW